ncbi:hypothetical protein [Streptomyces sp. NPDC017529]|uniref:hypothetical protein n=1 Tax=Streptomyces sp. NPDC017529 TaxID=3365000 RepID=UPI0037AEF1D6
MKRPKSRTLAAAAVTLSAGLLITACGQETPAYGKAAPSANSRPLSRPVTADADGRKLTTVVPVGGCQHAGFSASETEKSVTLSLTLTRRQQKGEVCTANVKLEHVHTELRRPLGQREIIDAATGEPVAVTKG